MHKSILDPQFKYINSVSTNLRETFARVRQEQAAAAQGGANRQSHTVTKIRRTP